MNHHRRFARRLAGRALVHLAGAAVQSHVNRTKRKPLMTASTPTTIRHSFGYVLDLTGVEYKRPGILRATVPGAHLDIQATMDDTGGRVLGLTEGGERVVARYEGPAAGAYARGWLDAVNLRARRPGAPLQRFDCSDTAHDPADPLHGLPVGKQGAMTLARFGGPPVWWLEVTRTARILCPEYGLAASSPVDMLGVDVAAWAYGAYHGLAVTTADRDDPPDDAPPCEVHPLDDEDDDTLEERAELHLHGGEDR